MPEEGPARPVLVSIISLVLAVVGALQAVHGFVIFLDRHDTSFLADADISSAHATTLALTMMIGGVIRVALAFALLNGSRLARAVIGVYEVLQIAFAVYSIVALGPDNAFSAYVSIAGAVIVLYFLFATDKAKTYFAH